MSYGSLTIYLAIPVLYARGRHFFVIVIPRVVRPMTSLRVQLWGGPLDRSSDVTGAGVHMVERE